MVPTSSYLDLEPANSTPSASHFRPTVEETEAPTLVSCRVSKCSRAAVERAQVPGSQTLFQDATS